MVSIGIKWNLIIYTLVAYQRRQLNMATLFDCQGIILLF